MKPVLLQLGPITIYSMGVFLFLAILLGSFVVYKKGKEYHFEEEEMFDVVFKCLFWALLGGRIVYVVLNFEQFGWSVLRWLWVTHYVGINLWGALAGASLWLMVWAKKEDEKVFEWLDVLALGTMLGLGIGMIGAFLNGSFQGVESSFFLAVSWPGREGVIPVQLWAAGLLLGGFGWLMKAEGNFRTFEWYRGGKTEAKSGFIVFASLIWLGVVWLILASWRVRPEWLMPGLVLLSGLVGLYWRSGREWRQDLQDLGGDKKKIEELDDRLKSRWRQFKK